MKTIYLNPEPRTLNPRRRRRRGVILLLVISLLALFILLGVSFSLVSLQSLNASKLDIKIQQVGDDTGTELDLVLGQLIYDTQARTVLQFHSLLRDLYGTADAITGTVGYPNITIPATPLPATPNTGNQFYTIQLVTTATLSPIPNYYAGRVITFRSGVAANHSARIVAYAPPLGTQIDPSVPVPHIIIEAIESKLAGSVTALIQGPNPSTGTPGDSFVINGTPFNGSGTGYYYNSSNPADPNNYGINNLHTAPDLVNGMGAQLNPQPVALLPNLAAYRGTLSNSNPADLGGLDETWDAVDLQNMFLAMVPPRAAEAYASRIPSNYLPVIPSFHRPELVNFWLSNLPSDVSPVTYNPYDSMFNPFTFAANANVKQFLDTITFRPMPWDHPNFSGSNPFFDAKNYDLLLHLAGTQRDPTDTPAPNPISKAPIPAIPWDVDNDNDSMPDSIWIDPGLPIITTPDGRRVKRLAAILIKDLDGSINLNAHGNLQQLAQYNRADTALQTSMIAGYIPPTTPYPYALGLAQVGQTLPRGLGFGPAEVSFLNVFSGDTAAYGNILQGRYASNNPSDVFYPGAPLGTNTAAPGQPNFRDGLSAAKHNGVPNDFGNMSGQAVATWYQQPSWYASPPDVWGRGAVALDFGGQPIYAFAATNGESTDSPYEMCLSGEENGTDTPYTVAELERILRYHDADALQVASRPLAYASNYLATEAQGVVLPPTVSGAGSHRRRNMLTTLSSDINVPTTTIPQEMRQAMASIVGNPKAPGSSSILDLYYARLSIALGANQPLMQQEMQKIVPWEFFKGQKFDINRWLGDGTDSDSDGARDDASESGSESAWSTSGPAIPNSFTSVYAQHTNNVNYFNGGVIGASTSPKDNAFARQLYARHLFCLAMLFLPDNFPDSTYPLTPSSYPESDADLKVSGTGNYRRLIVRRIAQWAVNCVDFRDQDSVMTPFEFDYYPWDGWHVDGNLATDGTNTPEFTPGLGPSSQPNFRGVVWGTEQPDLLITETLAFHDRRVKDTRYDSGNKKLVGDTPPDTGGSQGVANLDQFRVPQGSLFAELYCPRAARWSGLPLNQKPLQTNELYPTGSLHLGPNSYGSAIWRMAISKIYYNDAAAKPKSALSTSVTNPETSSFDPADVNLVVGSSVDGPLTIDRYAYFGDSNSIPNSDKQKSFYISSGSVPTIQPGQYAVVGPRTTTRLGSQASPALSPPLWAGNPTPLTPTPAQTIKLDATGVLVTNSSGAATSRTAGSDIRTPVAIICDAGSVTPNLIPSPIRAPWNKVAPYKIGLNLTEPMPLSGYYYPEPGSALPAGALAADFYDDPDAPTGASPESITGGFPDQPVDSNSVVVAQNIGRPIADNNMTQTGTYVDAASIFLQRLADPTLPYNPAPYDAFGVADPDHNSSLIVNGLVVVNPYITVDWATVDVTVFSGEENTNQANFDPDDVAPGAPLYFRSRQRGTLVASNPANLPWSPLSILSTAVTPRGSSSTNYFSNSLSNDLDNTYLVGTDNHTLGYLNQTIDALIYDPTNMATSGFAPYVGEPANPFPAMNWNNRPFSNPMELLCVPSSSPSRFTFEITPGFSFSSTPTGGVYYDAKSEPSAFRLPFGQLLNFFETCPITPTNPSSAALAAHLYRLLDYVEVPSPFAGTERWYNPQNFGSYDSMTAQFTGVNAYYRPPFNKLSRFRDPGRVNINTIFDGVDAVSSSQVESVWDATVGQSPGMRRADSFLQQVLASRQGDTNPVYAMNPNLPTRFANPFRTADSADLMPTHSAIGTQMRKLFPVESTFLRPDVSTITNPPTPVSLRQAMPLFHMNSFNPLYSQWTNSLPGQAPLPGAQGTQAQAHDINRNPYFRYQMLQKIGSVLTTRSNCFAVWITIGYFEVEENMVGGVMMFDKPHPDGYRLGQEIGIDTGEITRHRGFFIIDRSIPVGFIPGSRLNTDDCILVRRLIE